MAIKITGKISKVSGPVVVASNMRGSRMFDVARIGEEKLLGEIIKLSGDTATIQVYEDTTGLMPGQTVVSDGIPLTVELGPGLLTTIYDGIQRPLKEIASKTGDFIHRGVSLPALDRKKAYDFKAKTKKGNKVKGGDILGVVTETGLIEHRVLVPPWIEGEITSIESGKKTVEDVVATVKTTGGKKEELKMFHEWPIRKSRPITEKLAPTIPLITGQRVIDTFFPIAKGGTAAIPGPFGAGKTVCQNQLAKWSDAEVIVYIGCGERGNEMTEVLEKLPTLTDPKTGKPLMDRTVLIANTSNMPVAAREASVYTGITIAEYYRDMGYNVALMADSTSRWAEAMREISSRLEEMPGEEGYPAYLASRLAQFYERAGRVATMNSSNGSISVIGAVSPPGGDFSEPVTQNTLRITKVFWALDAQLAYRRHFPSINWLTSYSLYLPSVTPYFDREVAGDFSQNRARAMEILQKEAELKEIVQLVGPDALPEEEKIFLYTAKSIREDYLQQGAFSEIDSYCPLEKQYLMLKAILFMDSLAREAITKGVKLSAISTLPVNEKIARLKEQKDYVKAIKETEEEMKKQVNALIQEQANNGNPSEGNNMKAGV